MVLPLISLTAEQSTICSLTNSLSPTITIKTRLQTDIIMENKKGNKEEFFSRREFFKKAAKKTLPILGTMVLSGLPGIAKALESDAPMGCHGGSCYNLCYHGCRMTCIRSCKGGCEGNCRGTCLTSCQGCRGNCTGSCYNGCYTSCFSSSY